MTTARTAGWLIGLAALGLCVAVPAEAQAPEGAEALTEAVKVNAA